MLEIAFSEVEFFLQHCTLKIRDLGGQVFLVRAGRSFACLLQPIQARRKPARRIPDFAGIAGPGVAEDPGHVLRGQARRLRALFPVFVEEMLKQHHTIRPPLPHGRDKDVGGVQAVVEIVAKASRFHRLVQVGLGRSHHAQVQGDIALPAHTLEPAFFKDAQQAALGIQRHALDLVEEKRTLVRPFEQANTRRAQTAWIFDAKELLVDVRPVQRRTVHRHKRLHGPRGDRMQRPRRDFLARARLTNDQHVRIGRAQRRKLAAQALDLGRRPQHLHEQPVAALKLAAQPALRNHSLAQFQRPAAVLDQRLGVHGFLVKGKGTSLQAPHRHRYIAVAREQDHRHFRVDFLDAREQLFAVELGHAHVGNNDPHCVFGDVPQYGKRLRVRLHGQIGQLKRLLQ